MAALGSSWSAGHHLSALSNLASKLEHLERQAEMLDNLQEEEENRVRSFLAFLPSISHSGVIPVLQW